MSNEQFPRASFLLRMGAILYDLLVIIAVITFAAGAALAFSVLLDALGVWPLAAGADHAARIDGLLYQLYLLVVIFGFYALFWHRGGQTLGMKAWRLRVQNTDGTRISWRQAVIRSVTAMLGFGNIAVLFGKEKLALQDRLANCEVVRLTPEANQFKNWKKQNAPK